MAQLKITQRRGLIKKPQHQRRIVKALGLRGRHHTVTLEDNPQIRGMLQRVLHLVDVEEVNA